MMYTPISLENITPFPLNIMITAFLNPPTPMVIRTVVLYNTKPTIISSVGKKNTA